MRWIIGRKCTGRIKTIASTLIKKDSLLLSRQSLAT